MIDWTYYLYFKSKACTQSDVFPRSKSCASFVHSWALNTTWQELSTQCLAADWETRVELPGRSSSWCLGFSSTVWSLIFGSWGLRWEVFVTFVCYSLCIAKDLPYLCCYVLTNSLNVMGFWKYFAWEMALLPIAIFGRIDLDFKKPSLNRKVQFSTKHARWSGVLTELSLSHMSRVQSLSSCFWSRPKSQISSKALLGWFPLLLPYHVSNRVTCEAYVFN